MKYECGNGFVSTKWAKVDAGLDFYLVCPGPSLSEVDFDLRGRGRKIVGINTTYPKITPDIWVGMDKIDCYDRNLLWEPFPKVWRGNYWNLDFHGKLLKDFPETYFASVSKLGEGETMFNRRAHEVNFAWYKHTLGVALHLMVWMGAKTIHFVGNDLGGDKDYFDDRKLTDYQRSYNRRLYGQQIKFLQEFTELGVKNNIRCVSCTPHSPINAFMQYITLKDALDSTEKRHSYSGDIQVKHALDAE
jgi:hypothetical protein